MAGRVRNFLRGAGLRLADRFVSGQNYNPQTGAWTATPGQYVTGIGSRVLGFINPAAGFAANRLSDMYWDRQNQPSGILPQQLQAPTGLDLNLASMIQPGNFNLPDPNAPAVAQGIAPPQAPPSQQGGPFTPQQGGNLGFPTMGPVFVSKLGNQAGGARGRFSTGGLTGEAARAMFEGMSDASRFNTNMGYLHADRSA